MGVGKGQLKRIAMPGKHGFTLIKGNAKLIFKMFNYINGMLYVLPFLKDN